MTDQSPQADSSAVFVDLPDSFFQDVLDAAGVPVQHSCGHWTSVWTCSPFHNPFPTEEIYDRILAVEASPCINCMLAAIAKRRLDIQKSLSSGNLSSTPIEPPFDPRSPSP